MSMERERKNNIKTIRNGKREQSGETKETDCGMRKG
jgi:hypothetical protein